MDALSEEPNGTDCIHTEVPMFLLLLILSGVRHPVTHIDFIEINTCFDQHGDCYTQLIFWEWNAWNSRHQVMAWTMLSSAVEISRRGDCATMRYRGQLFRTPTLKVTRTHVSQDPERVDRKYLPEKFRAGVPTISLR